MLGTAALGHHKWCWHCAQDRLGPGAAKSSQNLQENAGGTFLSIFPVHSKILLPSLQGL